MRQGLRVIEAARDGDQDALEQLLIEYTSRLTRHVNGRIPAPHRDRLEVDDMVQEVLIKAFQNIGQLRECSPSGFYRWLTAIGDLTLIDAMRSESAQKRGGHMRRQAGGTGTTSKLANILDEIPDKQPTGSSRAARREALAALRVAVARLSVSQRRVIQLRYFEAFTIEEAARALDLSPAAVGSLLHRAKQNLAEAMGRASSWLSSR